ncbi:hypothetical protein CHS0354_023534 [Potamilus streckersoni]|uniref:Uncharacterized protein n=1 Tax=Potamilus streckersoni TaxID=2493646 RepID=A0AAE0RVH2_9BIVA|nr:hypothetical protein CHS0354_023534 [Potamilus streckersoni]
MVKYREKYGVSRTKRIWISSGKIQNKQVFICGNIQTLKLEIVEVCPEVMETLGTGSDSLPRLKDHYAVIPSFCNVFRPTYLVVIISTLLRSNVQNDG